MPTFDRKDVPWIAFLVALVCVFFYQFILLGLVPINADWLHANFHPGRAYLDVKPHNAELDDPIYQFYPLRMEAVRQWKEGHVPLWNPRIMCGHPLLADGISKPFDPFILAYIAFGGPVGRGVELLCHFLLMAVGAYFMAKAFGSSRAGAALTAVVYTFNLFCVTWMELRTATGALAFFPWAFIFLKGALEKQDLVFAGVCGLLSALMVLTGHPQFILYLFLVMSLLVVWHVASSWLNEGFASSARVLGVGFAALLVGVLLSAVETFPFLELVHNSARNPRQYEAANLNGTPLSLIAYVFPDFFGNPVTADYVGGFILRRPYMTAAVGFFGASTLVFVLAALFLWRDPAKAFFALLFLGVPAFLLAGAMGLTKSVSPYARFLPSMDLSRLVLVSNIAAAVLAGAAITKLAQAQPPDRRLRLFRVALVVFLACIILAVAFMRPLTPLLALFDRALAVKMLAYLDTFSSHPLGSNPLLAPTVFLPLLSMIAAGALALAATRLKRLVPVAAVLLVSCELLFFGIGYNPFVKKELIAPEFPFLKALDAPGGSVRVLGLDTPFGSNLVNIKGDFLVPNYAGLYGLDDIRGDESLRSDRYYKYMLRVAGSRNPMVASIHLPIYNSRFIDALSTKYILSAVPLWAPHLKVVYADGRAFVYENTRAVPRAYLVGTWWSNDSMLGALKTMYERNEFDPRTVVMLEKPASELPRATGPLTDASAAIVSYSPARVKVETDCSEPSVLVLTDAYYPGWTATVDSRAVSIIPANGALRAVPLPPGKHLVTFAYAPFSFALGAALSMATLALLAAMFFARFMLRRRSAAPATKPSN